MRGPFEPADQPHRPPAVATGPADAAKAAPVSGGPAPGGPVSGGPVSGGPAQKQAPAGRAAPPPLSPAAAKLEQIKDLYLTAEAIGEDALDQHFQQVSERQRQLIREYFDQAVKDATNGETA